MGLFKPAWMSDDWKKKSKALKEVEKETDQTCLVEIVKSAPLFDVRKAAISKLNNQEMLIDIAITPATNSRNIFNICKH